MSPTAVSSLRSVAKTKLFALFAIAFFLLISAIIVILFSSQSFTPSIDQLQSMVLQRTRAVVESESEQVAQTAVLGVTTNAQAFLFSSSAQTTPLSYEYDVNKTLAVIQKAQSAAPAFVLRTNEAEGFMVFITGKLGLSQAQSATIIKAMNSQLESAESDYVRISYIDRKTADSTLVKSAQTQKLPSTTDRVFFYVESTQETEPTNVPELKPISPKNPLELGIVAAK
ncbi:MAG: hypothetical protein WBO77_05030 [Microgenomates group bacterium]